MRRSLNAPTCRELGDSKISSSKGRVADGNDAFNCSFGRHRHHCRGVAGGVARVVEFGFVASGAAVATDEIDIYRREVNVGTKPDGHSFGHSGPDFETYTAALAA